MVDDEDKEMFIKLAKTEKSKILLYWLKDLVFKKALTMDDVLELMAEINKK